MSQKPLSFYGQLNYTEIMAALKSGMIKAQKIQTKKGEQIVFDVNVWVHEEADEYNNNASVQMSLTKEAFENNQKNTFYIGNLKYKLPTAVSATNEDINKHIEESNDDFKF